MTNQVQPLIDWAQQSKYRWWIEEIILRGRPGDNGGELHGAHVSIGIEVVDPTGQKHIVIKGPYPLDTAPDADLSRVLAEAHKSQAAAIQALTNEGESLRGQLISMTSQRDSLKRSAESLAEENLRLQQEIKSLLTGSSASTSA